MYSLHVTFSSLRATRAHLWANHALLGVKLLEALDVQIDSSHQVEHLPTPLRAIIRLACMYRGTSLIRNRDSETARLIS